MHFLLFIIALMQSNRCSLQRQSRGGLAENELLLLIADKVKKAITLSSKSKGRFFHGDSQSFKPNHSNQSLNKKIPIGNGYQSSHSKKLKMSDKICYLTKQYHQPSSQSQTRIKTKPEKSKKCLQKQPIIWNNFKLIPNVDINAPDFTCGECKTVFLRVDEFIFHCIEFCASIDHAESSHFIITNKCSSKVDQIDNTQIMISQSDDDQDPFWYPHSKQAKFDKIKHQTDWINKRIQAIKDQSKSIIFLWKQMKLQKQFIYDRQYRLICPSFIFAVNPFSNNLKELTGSSPTCKTNGTANNLVHSFHQHFLKQCCKVNTFQSTYLILWSEDFYKYLYHIRKQNILPNENDIGYTKYLYQKTPLKEKIDILYPRFQYYLGYYQAYIFFSGIHQICQFCDFQIPGKFMRFYYQKKHEQSCIVTNEPKKLFKVTRAKKCPKQFSISFFNIENIFEYDFFCPCEPSKKMSAQRLVQHLNSQHKDNMITIELFDPFKKEKRKK